MESFSGGKKWGKGKGTSARKLNISWLGWTWVFLAQFQRGHFRGWGWRGEGNLPPRPQLLTSGTATGLSLYVEEIVCSLSPGERRYSNKGHTWPWWHGTPLSGKLTICPMWGSDLKIHTVSRVPLQMDTFFSPSLLRGRIVRASIAALRLL